MEFQWNMVLKYLKPKILYLVNFIFELSNEVDIENRLETFLTTMEETIERLNIYGKKIASEIEENVFPEIQQYLTIVTNLGSFDTSSLIPLLQYGIENTKYQ